MQEMVCTNVNISPLNLVNTQSASHGEASLFHAGRVCFSTLDIEYWGEKKYKTLPVIWWYDVCCSPFEVEVGAEAGLQKVRAWGPGLKTGMVGKSADFVVEAINTEVGTLGETQKRYFSGKNMIF